jgi:pimeloyl-ACP methyl ester carboxylesterase
VSRRDVRRGYADGPYGQIHFRDHGTGVPLVLLHQAPMTSRQFDNVYGPLGVRGIRAIGIDMPGFGGSDGTPATPTVVDYAACVVPVLDTLGIDRTILLGHHTGALVATEVALRWPERLAGLILNGPMPLTEEERREWLATGHQRELRLVPQAGGAHFTQVFDTRVRLSRGGVPLERISDYVVQAFAGESPFWHGHHAAFTYDHGASIGRVKVPTMILSNTGDAIFDHASRAHDLRPDFDFVVLDGGGIDIVDEQPEPWSDAVRIFCDRHRPSTVEPSAAQAASGTIAGS